MSEVRSSEKLPARGLAEPRAEATRTTILDAAETLFAARGYAGTSMRELARGANTSQALLHHHFGTKAALYEAVKQRLTDRYNATQRPLAADGEDMTVVTSTVLGYFEFLRTHPSLSRLSSWARLEGDRKPWGGEDEIWRSLVQWAEQAKARGQLRDEIDPKLLLVFGAAAVQFWFDNRDFVCAMLGLDPTEPGLDDRYARHALDVLLFGAAARAEGDPAAVSPKRAESKRQNRRR
jgi:TetR/AcrR family transcriptional regulator